MGLGGGLISGCHQLEGGGHRMGAVDDVFIGLVVGLTAACVFIYLSRIRLKSELMRRTRALAMSEERHRLLLEQASDAIVVADSETGVILEVNRCACQLLGANETELVGKRHTILHPEARREFMRQQFAEISQRGEITEREGVILHRSGEQIPVQVRSCVITAGAHRYTQSILRDLRPRLKAEEELRRSEGRIRELFERTPVALIEADYSAVGAWLAEIRRAGATDLEVYLRANPSALREKLSLVRIVGANPAALRTSGAPDVATLAANVHMLIPSPSDMRTFRLHLDAIWNGRNEAVSEMQFARLDGPLGHGVMHWSALKTQSGLDLAHTVLVFSDLTELRQTEARLREVEDRWQLAVRALNVGIFEKNYLTGQTFLSDRWKEMLGFAPDELAATQEEWQARIHPTDRDRVIGALQAHLRGENDLYRVEYRMLCRDGGYKWIAACGRAVFDAAGHPVRLIGAHMDITDRVESEEALRESEIRYRRLFEDNPNPMWVYDSETFRFLAVNPAALRHYGYTHEEFVALTIFDIRPPADAERLREFIRKRREGTLTPAAATLWRHRRKNGTEMLMRVRSHLHEFGGRPAVLVLAEDVTERQEAEERLRASEQRYRDLFENAAEGVYQTTAAGQFRVVNPAMARLLGYSSPRHLITTVTSIATEFYADPNRRNEFFKLLGDSESVTGFESQVRCADGSLRWISENVRAIRDGEGRLAYLEGFVGDITERKRAEEAIRASEERYRVLFEHSPAAIIEYDYRKVGEWVTRLRAQGISDFDAYCDLHPEELAATMDLVAVVGVNEEMVRLTRARSKQELLKNFGRVFSPDGFAIRRRAFRAVWDGRQEIEGEISINALDGTVRRTYFRWWLPKLHGAHNLEWTQAVLLDLTDVRSAEAELAAERERLRVTLRAMAEGLMTTDTDGVVQFMNEAAERLTGWTAGAAIGRSIGEVCLLRHEKTRAAIGMPVARAISEHRVIDLPLQTMLFSRQGAPCLVDGRCAPMHNIGGRAIGAVVVFRDVTERARLESELLRSSKLEAVGILAGGIAHDFNNILTVVMGNVTLAMLDATVMDIAGRWLAEAERGVMRARDLTQQLLTFAKGGEPVRKAVQLPEVVREAAEFALHGSKVRCEFKAEPNLWAADVDKGQIGQVVQNLIINAVQAMPEGGIIRLAMQNEQVGQDSTRPLTVGEYLQLSISDSGMGIRGEHLSRIFDPYFTTKQSGSGLGLATVYSIIRKHQGHIEVESELGRGTTFHIWLPAARDALPQEPVSQDKPVSVSGRVLFMDDEETIRTLAAALLKRLGLDVTTVSDGGEAVECYESARVQGQPFRLVIMDLTVPGGMGGREAMQKLLQIDSNVKAIVSSGYSSDPVLANYRAHGFRGVVPKPYRFADLARTIQSVMEESV